MSGEVENAIPIVSGASEATKIKIKKLAGSDSARLETHTAAYAVTNMIDLDPGIDQFVSAWRMENHESYSAKGFKQSVGAIICNSPVLAKLGISFWDCSNHLRQNITVVYFALHVFWVDRTIFDAKKGMP